MNSETSTPVAATATAPIPTTPPVAPAPATHLNPPAQPAQRPANPLAAKYRKPGKFNRPATPPVK